MRGNDKVEQKKIRGDDRRKNMKGKRWSRNGEEKERREENMKRWRRGGERRKSTRECDRK